MIIKTVSYGGPGASFNRAGRIVTVTDGSGSIEKFYGKLGETVKEVKIVNTQPNPATYTTEYEFDSWGRLQKLIYPDGEVLTYQYDSGGLLSSASSMKSGVYTDFLTRLEYDKFGQRVFQDLSSGTQTFYTYDNQNRRLTRLVTSNAGVNNIQDITYGYDDNDNVTSYTGATPLPKGQNYGGPVSQTYTYDDLNRLTSAGGTYREKNQYSLNLTYDSVHNILNKNQQHWEVKKNGNAIYDKTSYNFAYKYNADQPHAPSEIGERMFSYDLNGNQTGWQNINNGTYRSIVWDDENRIQSVSDGGSTSNYVYDFSGERVIKRTSQGETVYVNQFYTVRNGSVESKHYFAGTSRIASQLSGHKYYYHPDHLGSTNYVT
ncbi:MAG: hypothetical protein OEZ36_10055, partial [Spirochaetota bacterium]|nr:hypothetical protein [Spirochaetota bacterium]